MYPGNHPSKRLLFTPSQSATLTLGAGSYCSFCHHGLGFFPMDFHTVGSLLCLASFT